MKLKEENEITRYISDFSGGVNLFLGPRQIKDNEKFLIELINKIHKQKIWINFIISFFLV